MYNLNTQTKSNQTQKGQTKEKKFCHAKLNHYFAVVMMIAMSTLLTPGAKAQGTTVSLSTTVSHFVGGANISCNSNSDGSVTLSVSGGTTPYTYLWSDDETTKDVSGLLAGTYTVTVTDASVSGVTATASITLTEPDLIIANIDSASLIKVACNGGNNGQAGVTAFGGTGGYTYMWGWGTDTVQTTPIATGLWAGKWSVTVTDTNGCQAYNTATVNEPPPDTLLLFSLSSLTYYDLDSAQKARYDTIMSYQDINTPIYFINIAQLGTNCNNAGTYKIVMPFFYYDSITVTTNAIHYISNDDYEFGGNIVMSSPYINDTTIIDSFATSHFDIGTINLIADSGARYGNLIYNNDYYNITDLSGGIQIIYKKILSAGRCGDNTNSDDNRTNQWTPNSDPCVYKRLKILFCFTQAGWTEAWHNYGGSMHSVAQQCLTSLANVWGYSQNLPDFSEAWASAGEIMNTNLIETNDAWEDIKTFSDQDISYYHYRQQYNADLVIFITNANYTDGTTGQSRKLGPWRDSAFAIVEANYLFGNYSFAHEIGHLFGARHETCNDDPGYPLSCDPNTDNSIAHGVEHDFVWYNWLHSVDYHCYYHDIMAYKQSYAGNHVITTVPCYSNTNENFDGPDGSPHSLGDYTTHDAAAEISNNYAEVISFYTDGNIPFSINVSTWAPGLCGDPHNLRAHLNVVNCNGPDAYYIDWYANTSGVNLNNSHYASNVDHIEMAHGHHWVGYVKITDATNSNLTWTAGFNVASPAPCHQRFNDPSNSNKKSTNSVAIFPNPNNGSFTLNINSIIDDKAAYEIINVMGQQVFQENIILNKGENIFEITKNNFVAGYYIIRVKGSSMTNNLPLIIE